jgi:hypothetical protein
VSDAGTVYNQMFERGMEEALRRPEVRSVQGWRTEAQLRAVVGQWRRTVNRRTATEQAAYDRASREVSELEATERRYQSTNMVLLQLAVLIVFLAALLIYQLAVTASPLLAGVLLALMIVAVVVALLWRAEVGERLAAWRAILRIQSWSERDRGRLRAAQEVRTTTDGAWRRAVVDSVLARLLVHIALREFSTDLRHLVDERLPAGLRETLDASFHVQTETGRRLAGLIRDLNGGSFALVGARGTGKTDLLGALALGAYDDQGAAPLLAVVIPAPVSYVPRDFVLQLFARTCNETVNLVSVILNERDVDPQRASDLRALRTQADEKLQTVLHQQAASQEASLTSALGPWGIGVRRSVSRSRLAYTYPELVYELRAFLEYAESVLSRYAERMRGREPRSGGARAADERRVEVVVAIDELDRMEGPEQARAFLQEVKGVLGVRNCCFIVAMAEETFRTFDADRPLSDLLDRAFDEVVHMSYLDLQTCWKLLASRISPPFSEQFAGLSFCLAGGVARDVIRTARGIVGTALASRQWTLPRTTSAMVAAEMRRAVNAARARLARTGADEAVTRARFLDEWVHTLADPISPAAIAELLTLEASSADPIAVRAAWDGVRTVAYFLLTILQVFDQDLDGARFSRGQASGSFAGSFESLARVRRRLGTHDQLAWAMLDAFRQAWGLPPPAERATRSG